MPPTGQQRGLVLVAVCGGAFMATLDTSIVSITLPQMARDFQVSLPMIAWVMQAYLMANAALLLTISQLGDMLPPGRLFLGGMLIFALASAACGWSGGLWSMVPARAIQGLGASLMLGVAPKIITVIYKEGERGLPFGLFSTAFASGVTIGAPLGGFIAATWGWPWIFFLNLPIAGLAMALSGYRLGQLTVAHLATGRRADWLGGVLLSASLALSFWALTQVRSLGWQHPDIWVALGIATLAFLLLILLERRQPWPLLPGPLWRRQAFVIGALAVVLTFAAVMGTFFLLPFYLVDIFQLPPPTVGWLLAVLSFSNAAVSPLGGLAGDRWGNLAVLRLGACLLLFGLAALWWWGATVSRSQLLLIFALTGTGFGLFQAPNLNEMLLGVDPRVLGLAAGTNAVLKNLGALCGIAIMVTIVSWSQGQHTPLRPGVCLSWGCFQRAFLGAVVLASLNLVINLLPRRRTP